MSKKEVCAFFGHRDFNKLEYKDYLQEIFEYLIKEKGIIVFLSGGMGNFDLICEGIVRELKIKYPFIKLKLVAPYLDYPFLKIFKDRIPLYDEIVIPNVGAENYSDAIPKRNEYIVENARFIISGVYKEEGGAYNAVVYAKEKNVKVINVLKGKKGS